MGKTGQHLGHQCLETCLRQLWPRVLSRSSVKPAHLESRARGSLHWGSCPSAQPWAHLAAEWASAPSGASQGPSGLLLCSPNFSSFPTQPRFTCSALHFIPSPPHSGTTGSPGSATRLHCSQVQSFMQTSLLYNPCSSSPFASQVHPAQHGPLGSSSSCDWVDSTWCCCQVTHPGGCTKGLTDQDSRVPALCRLTSSLEPSSSRWPWAGTCTSPQ